ncbi:MAG: class II fructose-bisphosphate aldolase [Acidobacteria bacterium]|nr:class II fructose-bisphosphate aldolase [Acidobacteriota bacterium]
MGLQSMKPMLKAAREGGYGVAAFNIVDYNSARAVVLAAGELRAPIIVQVSVKTVRFWGPAAIAAWMRELCADSPVPISLHLDHCKDIHVIRDCIAAGWTDVMIDASHKPFEENLALTREVVGLASYAGAGVEAELGQIGGVEEEKRVEDADAHLADPDKAALFCRDLPLAAFAPAIGTAHGLYKGEPRIAFDRLEAIARRTGLPIALHGGTGLSDDVFRKCIALGCAKVNISTQLKHTFIDSFVEYHAAHCEYEPLKPLGAQFERMKQEVMEKITLFGSCGRAAACA